MDKRNELGMIYSYYSYLPWILRVCYFFGNRYIHILLMKMRTPSICWRQTISPTLQACHGVSVQSKDLAAGIIIHCT